MASRLFMGRFRTTTLRREVREVLGSLGSDSRTSKRRNDETSGGEYSK